MQLSKSALAQISNEKIEKPLKELFDLPEKIVQFGTGVLLRGLCDYFVDKANRAGVFNGRIVVIKSTGAGDADAFQQQENLYTICIRGIDNEKIVEENVISSAISRVISARSQWKEVLELANDPSIQIIISNTTEVGLQLVEESITLEPPSSYPAKLLAFLHQRFIHFKGSSDSGMVVVPTELIPGNGDQLKKIVFELAAFNVLEAPFIEWLQGSVHFCNSLVDRIVTKDPGEETLNKLQSQLGYSDELLTMCEDYRLWAIEGNNHVTSVLGFTAADEGVFVKPDIEVYRSLKLHLLNGTHTFSASLAFLCGFDVVKEAMKDPVFFSFVKKIMLSEIGSAIPSKVSQEEIQKFGNKVLERFQNPFLQHQWINITLQNTAKMRMRNLPVLKRYQELFSSAPIYMAAGFAAYILFMKPVKKEGTTYYGQRNNEYYKINDDHAGFFYELWQAGKSIPEIVQAVLQNKAFWGEDLGTYNAFRTTVEDLLQKMISNGVHKTLGAIVNKRQLMSEPD
jgi:tagaturonate reductase